MENEKLAIFGGKPVRTKLWDKNACVGRDERRLIKRVLKSKEFSRYSGGPSSDINELLIMKSIDAEGYNKNYWNVLGGNMVRKFESEFSKFFKIDYSIAVNSATSGLITALLAAGVKPGDEVITTCMTFTATGASIVNIGAIPVFVDVQPKNYCINPIQIEKAISKKTKAIIVVHLLGMVADMGSILKIAKRHNLIVIEDCAQAPGIRYPFTNSYVGTIGDMGVFSFQETKNMMTGEGGMIITNNPILAKRCRLIRNHGETASTETSKEEDLVCGYNFRMTELEASIGISQINKLPYLNYKRISNTLYLLWHLSNLRKGIEFKMPIVPHVLPIEYNEKIVGVKRELFVDALRAEGIPCSTGYPRLLYEHPIFTKKKYKYRKLDCPVAEELIKKRFIWIFHIYHPLDRSDMDDIIMAFEKLYRNLEELRNVKDGEIIKRSEYAR